MVPGWGMEFGMGIGLEFQPSVSAAAAPIPTTNVSPAYLYGFPSADTLPIDDLLDFSNHDLFPSSADTQSLAPPPPDTSAAAGSWPFAGGDAYSSSDHRHTNDSSASFTDELFIPCEEAAELEWLSKFVEDSFSDVPYPYSAAGHHLAPSADPGTLVPGRGARSKRSRASSATANNIPATTWSSLAAPPSSSSPSSATSSSSSSEFPSSKTSGRKKGGGEAEMDGGGARRCTHCASEKTPQWRTGPLGPKTLCNACGVRYKSGRLVAEYRPAASPTFVLTQHSNSHRKVMELRRQKEIVLLRHDGSAASAAARGDMLFHDFEVC